MIKTLSIKKLESNVENIYEAVLVLAIRSRQINNQQKQFLVTVREYEDDYDAYQEDEVNPDAMPEYQVLPKPSILALDEFLSDKVTHNYQQEADSSKNKDA